MIDPVYEEEQTIDEIISEVRSIRSALAARFDYDLDLLFDEARRQRNSKGQRVRKASPKRLQPTPSP